MDIRTIRATLTAVAGLAACLLSTPSSATVLGRAALLTPLAPHAESRVQMPMPREFVPGQEVWIVYDLVAMSASGKGDGEVGLEQAFDGVKMPAIDMFTTFDASRMDSKASAGTIASQLQQLVGQRSPQELRAQLGPELYDAYLAVNGGSGRILVGRKIAHLPGPGSSDAPLLVSVERASGMAPVAVSITVGQGEFPAELQTPTEKSPWYRAGYFAGIAAFGWLMMRWFGRRRES